jgi:hypothetical protein
MSWIEDHPYLAGTLAVFLIVLFFVFRSRTSGSSSQVVSGPSDAVQIATLQAQNQSQGIQAAADVQSLQTQAALAAALANVQASQDATTAARDVALQNILTGGATAQYQAAVGLQATESTNQTASDIASTNAGAAVDIADITGNTQVKLATIQAPVTLAQIQASLDALKSTNETSLGIAGVNAKAATTINAQNVSGAENIATTNTLVPLAQTQGQVNLVTLGINAQLQALLAQIEAQQNVQNQAFQALPGVGGSPNRVAVITAALGQPGASAAASAASATSAAAGASEWGNFWNGLFGAVGASKGPGGTGVLGVAP